jgi:hypothetical protein
LPNVRDLSDELPKVVVGNFGKSNRRAAEKEVSKAGQNEELRSIVSAHG